MKVLLASHRTYPTLGGLENHIHTISKLISEQEKNNINILNLGFSSKETHKEKINPSYTVKSIRSLFIFDGSYPLPILSIFLYFLEILKFKPNIIHAHGRYFPSTILAFIYSLIFHIPFILTEHIEGEIYFSNNLISLISNYVFDIFIYLLKLSGAKFTVVSKTAKKFYKKHYNIDAKFIPNFINKEEINKALNDSIEESKSDKNFRSSIIFAGRLVESKGYKELENYIQANNKTKFTVVGEGKGRSFIVNLEKKYINIEYIPTLTHHNFLRLLYRSDGIIILSKQEGLSTIIMEAMAMGKIVISNKLQSNIELLSEYSKKVFTENFELEGQILQVNKITQKPFIKYNSEYSAKKYLDMYKSC